MLKRAIAVASLAVVIALAVFLFRSAGTWLVIDDPLQPAQATVVLGGEVAFRSMEAAAIYKKGFAKEVWLTPGGVSLEDIALAQLGIERPRDYTYSQQVLERLEVPPEAIHVLPGATSNTAEEVRAIARQLTETGGERVIIVTSNYHTRRVKILWHSLVGMRTEVIVHSAPDDDFDAARWYRTSADMRAVWREWFGLLNFWAGFPVSSERW